MALHMPVFKTEVGNCRRETAFMMSSSYPATSFHLLLLCKNARCRIFPSANRLQASSSRRRPRCRHPDGQTELRRGKITDFWLQLGLSPGRLAQSAFALRFKLWPILPTVVGLRRGRASFGQKLHWTCRALKAFKTAQLASRRPYKYHQTEAIRLS